MHITILQSNRQEGIEARLESAAEAGDEGAFLNILNELDWQNRPVEDFLQIISLALKSGAYLAARRISEKGIQCFPNNLEMQKYARILAPPQVKATNLPPDPGIKANRNWLKMYSNAYRSQWVALRNGELLGADQSLDQLVVKIGNTQGVLLSRVY